MLNRFMVVGLGGSGTATVRFLQQSLKRFLRQKKIDTWPDAWRLLAIDVQSNQAPHDHSVKRVTFTDQVKFKSLTINETEWDLLRDGLNRSDALSKAVDSWSPGTGHSDTKAIPLGDGAGQYRAVGRTVALSKIDEIAEALDSAFPTTDGDAGLRKLAQDLGHRPDGGDGPATIMVVIASLAGGAGSGLLLDVYDVLRAIAATKKGANPDHLLSFVYAPDVFTATLDEDKVTRVHANALATVSELMAASLSQGPAGGIEAVLSSAGGLGVPTRRGPRVVFVVGAKNLSGRNPVKAVQGAAERRVAYYEAAGHTLATWMTSPGMQTDLLKTYLANPPQQNPSETGLNENNTFVLSSAGFASVGLGNVEFAEYAAHRLARRAAENLRRGSGDPGYVETLVREHRAAFLARSGLSELGPQNNQVLDRIRSGSPSESPQRERLSRFVEDSKQRRWKSVKASAGEWIQTFETWLVGDADGAASTENKEYSRAATEWARAVPGELAALAEEYAGAFGVEVALGLLDEVSVNVAAAAEDLRGESSRMAKRSERKVDALGEGFGSVRTRRNDKFTLKKDGPVAQLVTTAREILWDRAESDLRALAADLLEDLPSNVIEPLKKALRGSVERLGDDMEPIVAHWPDLSTIPDVFAPTPTKELLLGYRDGDDGFKARFDDALAEMYEESADEGTDWAAGEIARGLTGVDHHRAAWPDGGPAVKGRMVAVDDAAPWRPAQLTARRIGSSSAASFEVDLSASRLLENAREWITGTGGPLKEESTVDLVDVLERDQAMQHRFAEAVREGVNLSKPLVTVKTAAMKRAHGKDAPDVALTMSELPFDAKHPIAGELREFLQDSHNFDVDSVATGAALRPSDVAITSLMWPPVDLPAMTSIVEPIAKRIHRDRDKEDDWNLFFDRKRAHRLDAFVPVSPSVLRAMIRGFLVGEALGLLDYQRDAWNDWADQCRIFDPATEIVNVFPTPMLTARPGPGCELPAILESVPLALVEFGRGEGLESKGAVKPYEVLRQLGESRRRGSPIPAALANWLSAGPSEAHAKWVESLAKGQEADADSADWVIDYKSIADAGGLEDPSGRREHLATYFEYRLDWYSKHHLGGPRTEIGPGPDEIAGDIQESLRELIGYVRPHR